MADVSLVSTRDEPRLLESVRSVLDGAEEALLCVAYVDNKGVNLLEGQLRLLGKRARLLATTTFGSTRPSALDRAQELGLDVRVLNPERSYHPKLYLGRRRREAAAFVGSANLTGGLATNYEIGVVLRGDIDDALLRRAWDLGHSLWEHSRAEPWQRSGATPEEDEPFDGDLLSAEDSDRPRPKEK